MEKKVWRQLSPDQLEKHYESMPRFMQAVAVAQEGTPNISYYLIDDICGFLVSK